MDVITVQREGTTLDLLLWRRFGSAGRSLIVSALELNPGLAALGAVLPLGTSVKMPPTPSREARPARRVISLFGAS